VDEEGNFGQHICRVPTDKTYRLLDLINRFLTLTDFFFFVLLLLHVGMSRADQTNSATLCITWHQHH